MDNILVKKINNQSIIDFQEDRNKVPYLTEPEVSTANCLAHNGM